MRFFKHIPECLKLLWQLFQPLWLDIIQQIYSNGLLKSLDKQITNWRRDFLFRGQMLIAHDQNLSSGFGLSGLDMKIKKGKIAFGFFFSARLTKIGT